MDISQQIDISFKTENVDQQTMLVSISITLIYFNTFLNFIFLSLNSTIFVLEWNKDRQTKVSFLYHSMSEELF